MFISASDFFCICLDIELLCLKMHATLGIPAQDSILACGNRKRRHHDLRHAIIVRRSSGFRLVLLDSLCMQVTADIERNVVGLKQIYGIIRVLKRTLGGVHPALGEQVVMCHRKHFDPMLLCDAKMHTKPSKRLRPNPTSNLISILILARIEHQKPMPCINRIDIAQRTWVPVRGLIKTKFVVDLVEFLP